MHDVATCCLIAVLAFIFGVTTAMLIKTIHLETKEHERDDDSV